MARWANLVGSTPGGGCAWEELMLMMCHTGPAWRGQTGAGEVGSSGALAPAEQGSDGYIITQS